MLEKYSDYDYLFWPDLAEGHLYAIETISFLDLEGLENKLAICLIRARGIMDFGVILKQEVCRGRLVVTLVAALQNRNTKALVFLNTEVLPTKMRCMDASTGVASRSGVTYLFH